MYKVTEFYYIANNFCKKKCAYFPCGSKKPVIDSLASSMTGLFILLFFIVQTQNHLPTSAQCTIQRNDCLYALHIVRNFGQLSAQQVLLCRQDFQVCGITTLEQCFGISNRLVQLVYLLTVVFQLLVLCIIETQALLTSSPASRMVCW